MGVRARLRRGGLAGCGHPEAYGGAGLGLTEAGLVLQAIGASGAGTCGASAAHFPPAARGELLVAFGVTEPGAGTDTSRITTSAQRQGDGWVVRRQKVWTTNAQNAQRILLLARTSPRPPDKPLEGMTLFFAPLDRARCTVRTIDKLGRAAVAR